MFNMKFQLKEAVQIRSRSQKWMRKTVVNTLDERVDLVMNNMIKRKSKRMRVEQWVEKTCEYVESAEYEPDKVVDNEQGGKKPGNHSTDSETADKSQELHAGGKAQRTYRKRDRSTSTDSSSSLSRSHKRKIRHRSKTSKRRKSKRKHSSTSSSESTASSIPSTSDGRS